MKIGRSAALVSLLAATVAWGLVPVDGVSSQPPHLEEVWEILDGPITTRAAYSDAASRLARLGQKAMPAVVHALWGVRPEGEPANDETPDEEPPPPDARREKAVNDLIIRTLRGYDLTALQDYLARTCQDADTTLDQRLQSSQLLGDIGNGSSIGTVVGIFAGIDPIMRTVPSVDPTFRTTLGKLLGRDRRSWRALDRAWPRIPERMRISALRYIRGMGGEKAVRFLVNRIGEDSDEDAHVLVELSRLAVESMVLLRPRDLDTIAECLGEDSAVTRQAAIRVIVATHHVEAFPALIDRLEDDDATTVREAHQALRTMSGMGYSTKVHPWDQWLEAEEAWMQEEGYRVIRRLERADGKDLHAAQREALKHRFHRHEFVPVLVELLRHESPDVRATACATLASLRSTHCLRALVNALGDRETKVVAAAWQALRLLTKKNLKADKLEWERLLGVSPSDKR